MQKSKKNQSHVRFTDEEYARVHEDAEAYGKTVPEMIKGVYFGKNLARPVLNRDDAQRVLAALARIGNNVNQIARQLNSGFRQGFNPAIQEVRDAVVALRHFIMGYDGDRQT